MQLAVGLPLACCFLPTCSYSNHPVENSFLAGCLSGASRSFLQQPLRDWSKLFLFFFALRCEVCRRRVNLALYRPLCSRTGTFASVLFQCILWVNAGRRRVPLVRYVYTGKTGST